MVEYLKNYKIIVNVGNVYEKQVWTENGVSDTCNSKVLPFCWSNRREMVSNDRTNDGPNAEINE